MGASLHLKDHVQMKEIAKRLHNQKLYNAIKVKYTTRGAYIVINVLILFWWGKERSRVML